MSREQKNKNSIQLSNKADSEKGKSQGSIGRLSFDVYFMGLMARNKKIQAHHKAPMRQYADSKGLKEALEKEFDDIFKDY